MLNIQSIIKKLGIELPLFPQGLVWLVGAGPGDPGLLTLHAIYALQQADVIVYDALVNPTILDFCRDDATKVFSGKRGGKPSINQKDISLKLVEYSKMGKKVVRLKGGDPFIFARGGDEALFLARENIPIRITPGITAGVGAMAYAGIPLTYRETNQSITFLTGHDQFGETPSAINWELCAKGAQVLVIYMAMKNLSQIVAKLLEFGRDPSEPVAVISNATLKDQIVLATTISNAVEDVQSHGLKAPAIICIGSNVSFHPILAKVINPSLKNGLNLLGYINENISGKAQEENSD